MDNPVFILAAGDQLRWRQEILYPDIPYKQLVKIGNKTLLEDIQDKFDSTVVISDPALEPYCRKCIFQEKGIFKIERIKRILTGGDSLFLLGDVYYTVEAVNLIKGEEGMFYGNGEEIFAVDLTNTRQTHVALDRAIEHAHRTDNDKIWDLYRAYCGYPLGEHLIGKYFKFIEDRTQDFDVQSEYKKYLNESNNIRQNSNTTS